MTAGLLFAMTLPGLVLLLLALATLEQLASRLRRRGPVSRRTRPTLSATGMDFMAALTTPDKQVELDQRAAEKVRRVAAHDADPHGDRAALDRGSIRIPRP